MSILTPGFPSNNPILMCVVAIESGEDVEVALSRRDLALRTAEEFFRISWDALGWFEPDAREYADGLSQQMMSAWSRLAADQQSELRHDMVLCPPRTRFQSELTLRLDPAAP